MALLMVTSYLAAYISPAKAWFFAFSGLLYPYILLVNILFVIFWAVLRKWLFLISFITIFSGWSSLTKLFQVRFRKNPVEIHGNSFKIVTYNVRLFNYYRWEKEPGIQQKIFEFINGQKPSIVCFQEFFTMPEGELTLSGIKKALKEFPYTHIQYTHVLKHRLNFGLATFSVFPIVSQGVIKFENSLNGSIFSDIAIGKDTVRLYNCHLQSVKLRRDYYKVLDNFIFNYNDEHLKEVKDMSVRLKNAFIQRALQADQLAGHIITSPYPVIICGDFNDTPYSYSYRRLRKDLKDAFIQSGSGIGTTYRENMAPVRIDYIFHSPSISSFNYGIVKNNWSDHYPVLCDFIFTKKADSSGQHFRRKE